MDTLLQESAGLRRTAPVQSPVPVSASGRLSLPQRVVVGVFVAILALTYLVQLVPVDARAHRTPVPQPAGGSP